MKTPVNTSVLASAELLRGRHFAAIAASFPDGTRLLLPTDTPARLERCGREQLVPGIVLDSAREAEWESVLADWMIDCDGALELVSAPDVRLALSRGAAAADADACPVTWDCGPWPLPRLTPDRSAAYR
jgi:hypothetical protein